MTYVLVVVNQKGGCAKTTTAHNLAAFLHRNGKYFKILTIDLDGQANLSKVAGFDTKNLRTPTVYEWVNEYNTFDDVVVASNIGDLIPANAKMKSLASTLSPSEGVFVLKELIENIPYEYDFIIMDTPPSLDLITVSALTASTHAVVVSLASSFSVDGTKEELDAVKSVKTRYNADLSVLGVLLTRVEENTVNTANMKQVLEMLSTNYETTLFETVIRKNTNIEDGQSVNMDILNYDPRSTGAEDYYRFGKEVLNRLNIVKE